MRWYHGWTVLAVTLLMQAVIWGLGSLCFTFWVLPWMEEFRAGRGEVMMGITASLVVMGLSSPVAGWAMDRFSIRLFICVGLVASALGFALISQATTMLQIIVIYAFCIGLSCTFAGPLAAQILAAKWFTKKRGLALGISATGQAWGGLIMPRFVTAMIAEHGWREAALIIAVVPLLLVPIIWFIIRNNPEEKDLSPGTASLSSASDPGDAATREWTARAIMRDRGFVIAALVFTPTMTAIYAILQNLAPYAHDNGFLPAAAASFMAVLSGFLLIGKLTFGGLSDTIDKRLLVWVSLLLLGLSFAALITKPTNFWYMLSVCAVLGLGSGALVPMSAAVIGSRFGSKAFGRAMGLLYLFTNLCAFGPTIMGLIRDEMKSYDAAILFFIFIFLVAGVSMAFSPKERLSKAQATVR